MDKGADAGIASAAERWKQRRGDGSDESATDTHTTD